MCENPLQCIICLETIEEQTPSVLFYPQQCHCKVIIHRHCASEWLQEQTKCLICKQNLQVNDYMEIDYSSETDYCSLITQKQRRALTKECQQSCIGLSIVLSILTIIALLIMFIVLFLIHNKKQ